MDIEDAVWIAEKANEFFQKFFDDFPYDIINPRDFCIKCFLGMLQGTSVTIKNLLADKNLKDAQILLRTQTERFIKLKKFCDDANFPLQFINQSQRQRLKFMEIALGNSEETRNNPYYAELKKVLNTDDVERLRKEVSQMPPAPNVWDLAKETNLQSDYYSTAFHSTVK